LQLRIADVGPVEDNIATELGLENIVFVEHIRAKVAQVGRGNGLAWLDQVHDDEGDISAVGEGEKVLQLGLAMKHFLKVQVPVCDGRSNLMVGYQKILDMPNCDFRLVVGNRLGWYGGEYCHHLASQIAIARDCNADAVVCCGKEVVGKGGKWGPSKATQPASVL
jgi:hypothetical protein